MVRSQRPQSNQSGGSPGALFVYLAGAGIARMALLARFNTTLARMGSNRQRALDTRVSSRDPVSLTTIDVAEGERLPLLTSNSTTLRCGRSPDKWVQCDAEGGALAMQRHTGMGRACRNYEKRLLKSVVHGTKPWECYPPLRDITHSCGQDLRLPTPSDPRQSWQQFLALFAILGLFALAARRPVLVVLEQLRGVRLRPPPEQCLHIQLQRDRTPWGSPLRAESAAAAHARRSAHYTQRESVPQRDLFSERERGDQRVSLPRPADCTLKATRSHTTCRVALPGTAGALTHDGKPGVSEVARGRINGAAAARDTNSELLPLARPGHMCLPIPISQSTYVASRITIVCRSSSRTGHKYNSRKSCR